MAEKYQYKNEVRVLILVTYCLVDSAKKMESKQTESPRVLCDTSKKDHPCYNPKKDEPDERGKARRFFEDSTFNGALYVFDSGPPLKQIFWGLVLVLAIGGFLAVTGWQISRLARDPTSTSITLKRENVLTFPAVTLCSLNLLNVTTVRTASTSTITDQRIINDMIKLFDDVRYRNNIQACQTTASSLARATGYNANWGNLTDLAKNQLATLLTSCRFVGRNCTADDFTPVSTVGGVCYTFNGPSTIPQRTVRGTGIRKGLQLQLSPSDQLFTLTDDYGFRIVIHNPDEPPRPESEGVAVALNSTTYIGMRQITSVDKTRFSEGFRCRGKDYQNPNQNLSFPTYSSYSPLLCQSDCFYSYIARRCNCIEDEKLYTPDTEPYTQLRKCNFSDICCEYQAFREVDDSCDCPPKCETVRHTTTVSSASNSLGRVNVNVYYESLITETRETEDSYTAWSLISDIGGNTGLFLGLTLLSGIELVMLVVELIKDRFFPKSCNKCNQNSKLGTICCGQEN